MRAGFSAVCFLCAAALLVMQDSFGPTALAFLLVLAALEIVRVRFCDTWLVTALSAAAAGAAALLEPTLILLFAVPLQGAASKTPLAPTAAGAASLITAAAVGGIISPSTLPYVGIVLTAAVLLGALTRQLEATRTSYERLYDQERRLRYDLESAKNQLLQSLQEQVRLTEAHERSRIARDIHDHVGHGLASSLLQLQAASKLLSNDPGRAAGLLETSIDRLSDSLTMMRDTVHRLQPQVKLGVDYLKRIVDEAQFCETDFTTHGDTSRIPAYLLQIAGTIIKEGLTNAARHARPTHVQVSLTVFAAFVRLSLQDNGPGAPTPLREGMGLSSIRERVQNLGGSVSFHSQNGFHIVCILPLPELAAEADANADDPSRDRLNSP